MRFNGLDVKFKLPFFEIGGRWEPDASEMMAAWELYVELVTRISVARLQPGEGLMREALSSLYALFGITRAILRAHGPSIAQPKGNGTLSFGYISVAVLNTALRPFLAKWHPLLQAYEAKRPDTVSAPEYEVAWTEGQALRDDLEALRLTLVDYANLLAQVADVPSLIIEQIP